MRNPLAGYGINVISPKLQCAANFWQIFCSVVCPRDSGTMAGHVIEDGLMYPDVIHYI